MKLPIGFAQPNTRNFRGRDSRQFALAIVFIGFLTSTALAQRPSISVSVSPKMITNQGDDAVLTLTASSPPTRKLRVNFFVTGTAIYGLDYEIVDPNQTPSIIRTVPQIVFPAGQSSVDVFIHTLVHDTGPHLVDTVQFFIERGFRYRVGRPDHVLVKIENLK
jgi:hypothetical protein